MEPFEEGRAPRRMPWHVIPLIPPRVRHVVASQRPCATACLHPSNDKGHIAAAPEVCLFAGLFRVARLVGRDRSISAGPYSRYSRAKQDG
jgi:hypothetical protein